MSYKIKRKILWMILILGIIDLFNSPIYFGIHGFLSDDAIFYYIIHLPLLAIIFYLFKPYYNDLINGTLKSKIKDLFESIDLPRKVKYFVIIIFFFNSLTVLTDFPIYPFYNVGMFSKSVELQKLSTVKTKTQYFYLDKNKSPIFIDLRKYGFKLLNPKLDLKSTHVFTFSINYHNRSKKENFNKIQEYLKSLYGIDSLYVGLQSVNFKTKQISYQTDFCDVINFIRNNDESYGNLYVPEYQKCKM